MSGEYTTEFESDHIFEFANEENEETSKVNHDLPEETYMTIYVKTVNGKTISIKCEGMMTTAVISEEVERISSIPRDMTHLVHRGKLMSENKTIKGNNIEAEATFEMYLRLLGGMDKNEQMDTHETEEDREKKRKLEEGKEGKMTKPNDDTVYLRRDIMEALKRSDEKWKATQIKTEEKMDDFSRKADEMLEQFLQVTSTVVSQIQGMNSSIEKMKEMNEKWKKGMTSTSKSTKESRI